MSNNNNNKKIKSTSQFLTCRSMQKNWCFFLGSLLSNYSHLGSIIKIYLMAKSLDGTIQVMEAQSHLIGKNNRQLSQCVCGCRYSGKGLFPESMPHHECECSSVSFCPQNCPVSVDRICAKDFCFLFLLFVVQSLFGTPGTAARQASLFLTISWSLLKLMSIQSAMPSNHLILCCLLLFLPSVFPSIRVFSKESALHIRWPKCLFLKCRKRKSCGFLP